jgi:hypothetical protein
MISDVKVLTSSMFVAVFGHLRPHPWITLESLEEDAYSLFLSRSELMGWSATAAHAGGSGLWGMNDASFDTFSTDEQARVGWFQVGIEDAEPIRSGLPFHPLVACATDTLRRVGDLEIGAIQFLVPLQIAGTTVATSSVPNWFNACDPGSRVGVRVTLDSGEDPIMSQVAGDLAEVATTTARAPFEVARSSAEAEHVTLRPEVTDGFWLGEGRHPVTFDAVAPDWSPDSIAWTAHLLAEACYRVGVRTSILINIAESGRGG